MTMEKIAVVACSGGVGSALALYRSINKYGLENVDAIFADTKSEAPDLYDFLDEQERVFGIKIKRLCDGRDIWDCFDDFGIIKTPGKIKACKASVELKIKIQAEYIKKHYMPDECVLLAGLGWMEPDRQERYAERWKPYESYSILNEDPKLSACEELDYISNTLGLKLPHSYIDGYNHNNCGGCCVMAGTRQWAATLKIYPERYAYHEKREAAFFKKHNFAILRDRSGGESKPLTLTELRERVEAGKDYGDSWKSTCNCMGVDGDQANVFELLEGTCDA